jgi:acetyl esterase
MSSLKARFPDLDPDIARILDQAIPVDGTPSLAASRETVRRGSATALRGPEVDLVRDRYVGSVPVREYSPSTAEQVEAVAVYLHGGGWVTGDLDYSDAVCRGVAAASGAAVVSVDYRLAPEARYPSALDDALEVVRLLSEQYPSKRVVMMGDSAGANLAAAAAARSVHDTTLAVAGQVLVYPLLDDDLTRASYERNDGLVLSRTKMQGFMDAYCPDVDRRHEGDFAPLKAASMRGLPDTVVVVAGHDPLHDEGVEYARRLAVDAVSVELIELPSLTHGFLRQTATSPGAAAATAKVVARAADLLTRCAT